MTKAQSIIACLLLGVPFSGALADDVKVHAPSDYLHDQILDQLDAVQQSDPTLSWPVDKNNKPVREVTIKRNDAHGFNVATSLHFIGNVKVGKLTLAADTDMDLTFDVTTRCNGAKYEIRASGMDVNTDQFGKADQGTKDAVEARVNSALSGLPSQINTAIVEATTAFGVPGETICKSVGISTATALDLSFDIGDCVRGKTWHSACKKGMTGKGIDRTCVDARWTITDYDCEPVGSNSGDSDTGGNGSNHSGSNGGGSGHHGAEP